MWTISPKNSAQHTAGGTLKRITHHHLGLQSIVKECTRWLKSGFNSIILFQNHEPLGAVVKLGDTECAFSGDDLVPQADRQIDIDVGYSSENIPRERAHWMADRLEAVLNALPGS